MAGEVSSSARARMLRQLVGSPGPVATDAAPLAHEAPGGVISPPAEACPDRVIGDIIRQLHGLSDVQVNRIADLQRERGMRFGEAAVALGLASAADVTWALAQQFHYPYQQAETTDCDPELVVACDPFSEQAETFRDLRSQLLLGVMAASGPRSALAVVSPDPGDGKSFFAANLAVAFSQLGGRTLLVDGDMRTPRLQHLFKLERQTGLSNVLAGRTDPDSVHRMAQLPNLHVLGVGTPPPNPMELLHRSSLTLLMHDLVARYDHVIVDTPAASLGADCRVLAAACGAALVIGRRNRTHLRSLDALLASIGKTPARLAGVLMNAH